MAIYVKRSDGAYVQYEGMAEDQITSTLADMGKTGEFIDEATFKAAIAAQGM